MLISKYNVKNTDFLDKSFKFNSFFQLLPMPYTQKHASVTSNRTKRAKKRIFGLERNNLGWTWAIDDTAPLSQPGSSKCRRVDSAFLLHRFIMWQITWQTSKIMNAPRRMGSLVRHGEDRYHLTKDPNTAFPLLITRFFVQIIKYNQAERRILMMYARSSYVTNEPVRAWFWLWMMSS